MRKETGVLEVVRNLGIYSGSDEKEAWKRLHDYSSRVRPVNKGRGKEVQDRVRDLLTLMGEPPLDGEDVWALWDGASEVIRKLAHKSVRPEGFLQVSSALSAVHVEKLENRVNLLSDGLKCVLVDLGIDIKDLDTPELLLRSVTSRMISWRKDSKRLESLLKEQDRDRLTAERIWKSLGGDGSPQELMVLIAEHVEDLLASEKRNESRLEKAKELKDKAACLQTSLDRALEGLWKAERERDELREECCSLKAKVVDLQSKWAEASRESVMWNSACRELTANGKILGQSLEAKVREQAQLVYDKSEELSKIQEYLDAVRDRVVKILGDTGFRVSVTSSLDSLLSMMESPEFTGVSRGGAVRVVGGEKSSDRDRLLVRIKRLSSEMEDFRVLARLAASCVFGSGSVLGNEMLREALEELGYGEEDGS